MLRHNKTAAWLSEKSNEEATELTSVARRKDDNYVNTKGDKSRQFSSKPGKSFLKTQEKNDSRKPKQLSGGQQS